MIRYENECVGCPPEIGCFGASCPKRNVPHFYCDKCGNEDILFYWYDRELCIECIAEELDVVEGSD